MVCFEKVGSCDLFIFGFASLLIFIVIINYFYSFMADTPKLKNAAIN